ncbi:APC family permease [Gordonia sp. i37]|uniref:APC family permease n=1 Tax=Gordonia sp. i37 TaxID=1961707 RepID=UPI0009AE2CE0|nr:APC family permease [Gordonia sp. i37]OPX14927.1 hypothetical protein B1964_12595 [Gordonia sp. i37]
MLNIATRTVPTDSGPTPQTPEPSDPAEKRRLTATTGLAALSLDAMASVAYGPEAIVVVLAAAGSHALGLTLPVSAAIVALLAILIASYRQLIAVFPDGGGAYASSKRYLGRRPALVAAASLVIDYVLNVAVSVAAGTAALTSAIPAARPYTVWIGLGVLVLITAVNLRGIVSSAMVFMAPTVIFIVSILSLIVVGLITGGHPTHSSVEHTTGTLTTVGLPLVLKAFANGCAALTGVEAIANATPQFRQNRVRRAQHAEVALGVLLGAMMLGVAALVEALHIEPRGGVTVLSQITEGVFGRGALYYVIQAATVILLALAANTSFGGLPQLMKVVAADDYLPHRLTRATHGVYREGVLVLAVAAGILIAVTEGNVNLLVPLFAICVFIGFTLAQLGLVRHWWTARTRGWRWRLALNAIGATATGLATVVVTVMKADEGSLWVIVVLVVLVASMSAVSRAYRKRRVAAAAADHHADLVRKTLTHRSFAGQGIAVVPVSQQCTAVDDALRRARSFGREVRVVHVEVAVSPDEGLATCWRERHPMVPLETLYAVDEDSIVDAITDYVDGLTATDDVLVVIPDPDATARSRLLSAGRADDLEEVLRRDTAALVTRVCARPVA